MADSAETRDYCVLGGKPAIFSMVRPRMLLIAVRANSEEGVFEANEERNSSTLSIKWAPFI